MKYRRRNRVYLEVGCSQLIIAGEIGLLQFDDIEQIVAGGALLKDATLKAADLLVPATAYYPAAGAGAPAARRGGNRSRRPSSGASTRTASWRTCGSARQDGPSFMGGGPPQARIYSKTVALQIKAIEIGLI